MYNSKKNHFALPLAAIFILLSIFITLLASCGITGEDTGSSVPGQTTSARPNETSRTDTTAPDSTTSGTPVSGEVTTEAPVPVIEVPANTIDAAQAVIYDVSARRVIYSYNGVIDGKVYPASTTKLFTAWVALQYLSPDEVITAGDELSLVASDASIAYIRRGHKLTAAMLVEAMLLPSGGDAAYVIAAAAGKKIRGNSEISAKSAISAFVGEMNTRLAALGLTGTHFVNPDGYHDPAHYTTLEDIARIGALALENETIMKYAKTPQDSVIYASGQTNKWKNTNALIDPESRFYRSDAIGLKTGSTDEAGYCVLTATRDSAGRYYVIGIFGASTGDARFLDAARLIGILRTAVG